MNFKIDNLQYCKWERSVFEINREANLDAVHVTVVYHEDFDEFKKRLLEWKENFEEARIKDTDYITSFIFQVRNIPSALFKALGGFSTNKINMLKL